LALAGSMYLPVSFDDSTEVRNRSASIFRAKL
jgi:hypothetical protein